MKNYKIQQFPKTRLATIDISELGKQKNHIASLIAIDVTAAKEKIQEYNSKNKQPISFTAWLLKVIGVTIKQYSEATAYLYDKRKVIIFKDINISIIVEKEVDGQKVPIPLIIEKVQERSIISIAEQIRLAKQQTISEKEIVLQNKANPLEYFYYTLPSFIRRMVWKCMLKFPRFAYKKMGNVAFTSIGMMGNVNGWFIPLSVHPICFGVSSINKEPKVINDQIVVSEVLKMTVLFDHDVVDGSPMVRFLSDLTLNMEKGLML